MAIVKQLPRLNGQLIIYCSVIKRLRRLLDLYQVAPQKVQVRQKGAGIVRVISAGCYVQIVLLNNILQIFDDKFIVRLDPKSPCCECDQPIVDPEPLRRSIGLLVLQKPQLWHK